MSLIKRLLFIVFAGCFALPAFADIDSESMCVVGTLGASENNSTVEIEADWTPRSIQCNPGFYLDALTATCIQCPAGSYCDGGTYIYNDSDQGKSSCPVAFPSSVAQNASQDNCYADGSDICATRNPYTGGHGSAIYANSATGTESCKTYYGNQSNCVLNTSNACDITGLNCDTGYIQDSTVVASPLMAYAEANGNWTRYRSHNGVHTYYDSAAIADITGLEVGEWEVDWSNGNTFVRGISSCNTIAGTDAIGSYHKYVDMPDNHKETSMMTSDSTGQYCWCRLTGYSINGGTYNNVTDSEWLFIERENNATDCATDCAGICADYASGPHIFPTVMFSGATSSADGGYFCRANSFTITLDDNGGAGGTGTLYEVYDDKFYTDSAHTVQATSVTVPTREGYAFMGYYASGTNTRYIDEGGVILSSMTPTFAENTTLVAQWVEIPTEEPDPADPNPQPNNISFCPKYEDTPGYDPEHYLVNNYMTKNGLYNYYYYYPAGREYALDGCQVFWLVDNNLIDHTDDTRQGYTHTFVRAMYNHETGNYDKATQVQFTGVPTNVALHCESGYANGVARNGMIYYPTLAQALTDSCTLVEAGSQCDGVVEDVCEQGFYCPGQCEKIACPTGYTTAAAGATQASDCYPVTYSITYVLGGGTNYTGAPTEYTVNSADITFGTPIKTGYTFGGWYENQEYEGNTRTQIASGSTGDVTLYAKWAANILNIVWEPNNGQDATRNQCTYDDVITLPDQPSRFGYNFTGWQLKTYNSCGEATAPDVCNSLKIGNTQCVYDTVNNVCVNAQ